MPDRHPPAGPLVHDRPGVGRRRWLASLGLGTALCLAVFVASNVGALIVLGHLEGLDYALVGLVQVALVPLAALVALKPVGLGLRDVGLRTGDAGAGFRADVLIGLGVALVFAALQFGLIIPATGGAERSDVAMNATQIGESFSGVIGFAILAVTGGLAEELFFRGVFLTTLRNALGRSTGALVAAFGITVVFFGLLHGYQGVAGIIDTGLYGGLVLTGLYVWRHGRLTAGIVAHAVWNTLAALGIWTLY